MNDSDNISTISDYILVDQTREDFVFQKYFHNEVDQLDSEPDSDQGKNEGCTRNVTSSSEYSSSDSSSEDGEPVSDIDEALYITESEAEDEDEKEEDPKRKELLDKLMEKGYDENLLADENENELLVAVRNDAGHLIDLLLPHSSPVDIFAAVMLSIQQGRDNITKKFIQHARYNELKELNRLASIGALDTTNKAHIRSDGDQLDKCGLNLSAADDEVFYADDANGDDEGGETDFLPSYITPLNLACQKNQIEIVKMLMQGGERIEEPHAMSCDCYDCQEQTDTIKKAKIRLVTYQAFCSDSYVILSNTDPILKAFELGKKMQAHAESEKHYKAQYLKLAEQVAGLSGRILDVVQCGSELQVILDEKSGSGMTAYTTLARLKLAVSYQEKQFIAHAACQKKLASLWIGDVNPDWVQSVLRTLLCMFVLFVIYPFLAIAYWCYPKNKIAKFMESPMIKFAGNTISYIIFILLVIVISLTDQVTSGYTLSNDPDMGVYFRNYTNYTDYVQISGDTKIRPHSLHSSSVFLSIWVIGMVLEVVKKMVTEGSRFFTDNMFNLLNLVQILLYMISFGFRFHATFEVNDAIDYFSNAAGWEALSNNDSIAMEKTYWLESERQDFVANDPTVIAEAVFAVGSILTICKMTYAFTVSERIGPLVLSVAAMFGDVTAFMMLFFFIITAFCVGFHNVYWYMYSGIPRVEGEPEPSQFTGLNDVIELFFWSIFGLGKFDAANTFDTTLDNNGITLIGTFMFALYNWLMVIILLNILIATMSKSYMYISEKQDMEWKFARTKLYLDYMKEGATLPSPFNIIPMWVEFHKLYKDYKGKNWRNLIKFGSKGSNDEEMSQTRPRRRSSIRERIKQKLKGEDEDSDGPSAEYKAVMLKVVLRLVDKYANDDSEEAGYKLIAQDISTLRQELMSHAFRQMRQRQAVLEMVNALNEHVIKSREACTRQHANIKAVNEMRVAEIKSKIGNVENHVNTMFAALGDTFQELEDLVEKRFEDFRKEFTRSIEKTTTHIRDVDESVSDYEKKVFSIKDTVQCHAKVINVLRHEMATLKTSISSVHEGLTDEMTFHE